MYMSYQEASMVSEREFPFRKDLPVSTVRTPHPRTGQLVDFGLTFRTKKTGTKFQHDVLHVQEGSWAKKLKIRKGDLLHSIGDLYLQDCEHSVVLNKFYRVKERFFMTVKRKATVILSSDGDDDRCGVCTAVVNTSLEIHVKLDDDGAIQRLSPKWQRTVIEKPGTSTVLPEMLYQHTGMVYIYPAHDNTSVLSMTSASTAKIVPAHLNDMGARWTAYTYLVMWPHHGRHHALAWIFYNNEYDRCLVISTGSTQKLTFKEPLKDLDELNEVDSQVFFSEESEDDRIVFESAFYQGLYLAVSGDDITLVQKGDLINLRYKTQFNLQIIEEHLTHF